MSSFALNTDLPQGPQYTYTPTFVPTFIDPVAVDRPSTWIGLGTWYPSLPEAPQVDPLPPTPPAWLPPITVTPPPATSGGFNMQGIADYLEEHQELVFVAVGAYVLASLAGGGRRR